MVLSDYLRHAIGLTGTHVGCEQGNCGSCTVLLDGVPVRSCLLLAVQAQGHEIETVEGLADATRLSPLQRAMLEEHGLQCGFCTPGMVMSALDLVKNNPNPTEREIREYLEGNLCRCTGYHNIVLAIKEGADVMRGAKAAAE